MSTSTGNCGKRNKEIGPVVHQISKTPLSFKGRPVVYRTVKSPSTQLSLLDGFVIQAMVVVTQL